MIKNEEIYNYPENGDASYTVINKPKKYSKLDQMQTSKDALEASAPHFFNHREIFQENNYLER